MSRLFRLLNLRPREGREVFLLVVRLFLSITGMAWAETFIESSPVYSGWVGQLLPVSTASVDRTANPILLVAVCGIAWLAIGVSLLWLGINQILAEPLLLARAGARRTSFLIHGWNQIRVFEGTRPAQRIVPGLASASPIVLLFAGFTIPLLDRFLPPAEIILLWVATLSILAMRSWVMSWVSKAGAESEPGLVNTPHPRKERGSYLRKVGEGFQSISSSHDLHRVALSTFPHGRPLPVSAQGSPGRGAGGLAKPLSGPEKVSL